MFEVHSQFCTRSGPSLSILLEPPYSSAWQEHSPTSSALDSQNGWCQVGAGIAHSSPKASPPGPILTGPKFWFPSYDTSYDVGSSDPAYPSMASQSSSWAQQVEERPRQPVTHSFESLPSKSKSKRRRARHLKCVREPLPQILAISPDVRDERFVGSELARADEWHALQQALLLALEDPDQVQRAVALVESLIQREDQGSLGWWICQEVFHLSTHFDVTLILLISRGLETLRKSKPCGRRILQITSCNITTWRSEVKQWMATQEDVILVQEHHLLAPALSVEIEAMGAIGYDSFLMPASPGQGSRNSSQGGVGILVKAHLGARLRAQFSREGCGYVAVTIRTQGADLTLVSLYLQCSTGYAGPVNAAILSSLRDLRHGIRGPLLVGGDWNVSLPELLETSIMESLLLRPMGTNLPTCGDHELDYAGLSPCLEGLTTITSSWDVPFKPHAALRIQLQVGAFQMTTPQLPVFAPVYRQTPAEYRQVEERLTSMPDCEVLQDPISDLLASISHSIELSLLEAPVGISRHLQVTFLPAVPRMSIISWEGSSQAFWHRLQFLCTGSHRHLLQQGHELIQQAMTHWHGDEPSLQDFLNLARPHLQSATTLPREVLRVIQEQIAVASQTQASKCQKTYRTWLQGAQEKGMAPLFKAIRKGEATTARPYRDLSAEARALARAKDWLSTWKGFLRQQDVPPLSHVEQQAREELKRRAALQAASLPPLTAEQLRLKFTKGRVTAPGPDGWNKTLLKKLTQPMLEDVAQLYHALEKGVKVPQQFTVTQVCMLPKSPTAERPISLTHVLWRDYCRVRWPLLRVWLERYQLCAPWDSAVPGRTCLDVGIRRLLWAEASRTQSKHFIGMFLDIRGFYDSVSWHSVVQTGLALEFPPLLLELGLQIYGGPRLLSAENSVSPGIIPTVGLLQGCPIAPAVSKLALHMPLQQLHQSGLTHNIDQWLDDISTDVVGPTAASTAQKALKCFRMLRDSLAESNLQVSLEKTKFLCSDSATSTALSKLRQDTDPGITLLAKDLGVDSNAGRRRRLATFLGRQGKAKSRSRRMRNLRIPRPKARIRLARGSVLTSATYGHQSQGISPKRMKWLRATLVSNLGRQTLGGTLTVLEIHSHQIPDPLEQIVCEHVQVFLRILSRSPAIWEEVQSAWPMIQARLEASPHPWKIVAGPISAMMQYCRDLGWGIDDPKFWQVQGQVISLDFNPFLCYDLQRRVRDSVKHSRLQSISLQPGGHGAQDGLDWTIHRRLVAKGGKKLRFHQAIWQAAVVHKHNGGHALCPRCQQPNTLEHVLWDCSRWAGQPQLSAKLRAMKATYSHPCLWLRALVPSEYVRTPLLNPEEVVQGIWPSGHLDHDLVIGTDASGGRFSSDPRLRAVGWAVVLGRRSGTSVHIIATASGVLPRPATVLDGEVFAIAKALELSEGVLDVTTDSRVACRQQKTAYVSPKHSSSWKSCWDQRARASLTWIKAHLDQSQFAARYGEGLMWRWHLNQAADDLAGRRANQAVHPDAKANLRRIDTLVSTISQLLSQRAECLITTQDKKTVFCKREPKAPTVNKRQQIEQLVSGPMPASGHAWEIRSRHPTNLTAACSACGLWIQQVDPPVLFKQTLNQPCLGRDGSPPPYFAINPSHKLVSVGKGWQCTVCEGILPARARKVPRIMTANCVVRHKTNALSNSTRGLLSGMGAPSNIPLSGRLGKKPKDSVAIARNLSNFFSTPSKIKVEETPLTHCVASSETCNPLPSKDEHPAIPTSCGFSRNATHPDVRVVTVHTPLHTSGPPSSEACSSKVEDNSSTASNWLHIAPARPTESAGRQDDQFPCPTFDLKVPVAFIKRLKFQNPSNHCYANSLVVGFLWIDLIAGNVSPFANSPLHGILRWLKQQKKVLLWQSMSWTSLVHSQGRWQSPNSQHDVCHLLMHISHAVPAVITQISWRLRSPGVAEDEGNMWPLPLVLEGQDMSLKDALIKWQQSGVTILTRPPIIALQLGRFVGTAPDFRRVATRVDFQDPCVLEDLDGRVLVYEPRAVIIHLGESPLAGHYRTYLLPSKLLTDDFTGATSAKPADLSLIGSSAYLVLLVLQV